MKKPGIWILVLVTCIFVGFVLGFFTGRNLDRAPVQIQAIPTVSTLESVPDDTSESEPSETVGTGIIDINTATVAQLQTLPGIGEVIAQRIVDYRNANGPFQSVGELIKVKGIGEKRLEDIWDLVTTGG